MSLSPCVGLCRLDAQKVCAGCHRTLDEISRWGLLTDDEQRKILHLIAWRQSVGCPPAPSPAAQEPTS